jgi:membrane dipeptidase
MLRSPVPSSPVPTRQSRELGAIGSTILAGLTGLPRHAELRRMTVPSGHSRRTFLGGVAASLALAAHAQPAADQAPADIVTVDLHSHAGRVTRRNAPFEAVAAPMRAGGLSALCLAIVADGPVTRVLPEGRIQQVREPAQGELAAWGETAFARAHALIADQGLAVITTLAELDACRSAGPGAIVTSEGADFLDGSMTRLDEAYRRYRLRQLQLTHYRVNELGDIQTESPVHDGLTAFGVEVVRGCNRLGIVVDVAHGTYELVKQAAAVTTRPLILSHSSLADLPRARSRLISPEHARAVAATGGVVGVWPARFVFANRAAFAAGVARMVDAVGIDHVGIGTDMLGLPSGSVFDDYSELPAVAAALRDAGLDPAGIAKVLGGNYRRVFAAVMASA